MTRKTFHRLQIAAAILAAFGTGYCLGFGNAPRVTVEYDLPAAAPAAPAEDAPLPVDHTADCTPRQDGCAWVNTKTHLIYLPRSIWYGVSPGPGSRYMTIGAARAAGYQVAPDGR